MAGINIFPQPAASAVDEPEIPANNIETATFTCPKPPGIQPVNTLAKSINLSVIFPEFIKLAANKKKGTASKINELYD